WSTTPAIVHPGARSDRADVAASPAPVITANSPWESAFAAASVDARHCGCRGCSDASGRHAEQASAPEPEVRTRHAASEVANFGFKRGTRIIELLVSL